MNAHTPPPVGSVEELRAYAADCFRLVRLYAGHAEDLAGLGMDEELAVTTRKLLAAAEAASRTVVDLRVRT